MKDVRPFMSANNACRMESSVSASTDDVASSRYQDTRVFKQRPRQNDTLLLTTGERYPAFTHQRIVGVGEGHDDIVNGGGLGGGYNLGIGHLPTHAVGDVLTNGAGEQEWFLLYNTNLAAQVMTGIVLQVLCRRW